MAARSTWGQQVPQVCNEAQDELMLNDDYQHTPFSSAQPSQEHSFQWQQQPQPAYLDPFAPYDGGPTRSAAIAPSHHHPQDQGASRASVHTSGPFGSVQTTGYSISQGVAPSSILPGTSRYGAGARAATANDGNIDPNLLSTPAGPFTNASTFSPYVYTNHFAGVFGPGFGDPAYEVNYFERSNPDPRAGIPDFCGNNLYNEPSGTSSQNFGATHAQASNSSPLPQLPLWQSLPSGLYQEGSALLQPSERGQDERRLNQQRRLNIANLPFDGSLAPANNNDPPPAGVFFHQRIPESAPPSSPALRLPRLTPASPDYPGAYDPLHAPARERVDLGQVEGLAWPNSSNSRAHYSREEQGYVLHGNSRDDRRQEEYIPGNWNPGEWTAGREPEDDSTNDESPSNSSVSVFRSDKDLSMPPSGRSQTPRESGASRKRARPSADTSAGPSRQKRRAVSVASHAAAKVRKTSCSKTAAAGWDQDDPFTIRDDEGKKIQMVDMTADDNIPEELQIVPEPPSTKLSKFECIICLDAASTLTVTHCGHMFCGACLYQALHAGATRMVCPMCRQKLEHRKWDAPTTKTAKTLFHLELKVKQTKTQGKQPARRPLGSKN